jgi:hypothetical protein
MQKNIYLCDMEKEFVIYSLALRMKKLGYNGSCFAFYQVENFEEKPCGVDDRDEYIRTGFATCKNSEIPEHFTSAPTWQQAFRWFREKHDLHAEPYTADMGAIEYCFRIRDLYSEIYVYDNLIRVGIYDNLIRVDGSYHGTFNTLEDAELACLEKLIQIVEQKTEVI